LVVPIRIWKYGKKEEKMEKKQKLDKKKFHAKMSKLFLP
jgi:hypothetical protein